MHSRAAQHTRTWLLLLRVWLLRRKWLLLLAAIRLLIYWLLIAWLTILLWLLVRSALAIHRRRSRSVRLLASIHQPPSSLQQLSRSVSVSLATGHRTSWHTVPLVCPTAVLCGASGTTTQLGADVWASHRPLPRLHDTALLTLLRLLTVPSASLRPSHRLSLHSTRTSVAGKAKTKKKAAPTNNTQRHTSRRMRLATKTKFDSCRRLAPHHALYS